MIILATGNPTAKVEGEHIAIRVPSGKDDVVVAVSLDQAFRLERLIRNASIDFLKERSAREVPETQIIAFPSSLVRRV